MDGEHLPKKEKELTEPRPEEVPAERSAETAPEPPSTVSVEAAERPRPTIEVRAAASVQPDQQRAVIERILEDGLRDTYFAMPTASRTAFRAAGESLARRFRDLAGVGRALKPNDVYRLVIQWLASIPGVNRFFKMQAAKIKTDRLLDEIGPPAGNP